MIKIGLFQKSRQLMKNKNLWIIVFTFNVLSVFDLTNYSKKKCEARFRVSFRRIIVGNLESSKSKNSMQSIDY